MDRVAEIEKDVNELSQEAVKDKQNNKLKLL